ncbi:MAG: transcriptional regulator [Candidatus Eremiobacteraeota bacterium]|nr:transcriptional regulator [Candidatus Eremiobacteraeota bacterium]
MTDLKRARATNLDPVFHERARLGICSTLVAHSDGVAFTLLQERCHLTDGNLNRHLHALVEERIIETERRTGPGRPQTTVRITTTGRERFLAYIDALEAIVRDVHRSASASESPMRVVPARSTSQ